MFFKKTMALLAAVLIVVSSGAVAVFAQEIEANRPVLQEVTITERNQGPESTPEPGSVTNSNSNTSLSSTPQSSSSSVSNSSAESFSNNNSTSESGQNTDSNQHTATNHNTNTAQAAPPATRRVTNTNAATKRTNSSSEAEASSSELSSTLIPEDVSSDLVSLPDVGSLVLSVPNAMGSGTEAASGQGNHWYGVIAWVCIGVGVIIVLVILVVGNRRSPRRRNSVGRKRYHRKPFKSGKKHLLDDRYYSNKYRRR